MSSKELTGICIRKIPKQHFNEKENQIRKLAKDYGIVDSVRHFDDNLFVNFSKITDIKSCMDEFRLNGFDVEESRRNKPQDDSKRRSSSLSQSKESLIAGPSSLLVLPRHQEGNQFKENQDHHVPGVSNATANKLKSGNCVLCHTRTVLVCQRCTDFYCSEDCQMKDWQSHRFICFPIPKLIDVSQLQADIRPIIPAYNVGIPPMHQSPTPLMHIPFNNNFMQQARQPKPAVKHHNQQQQNNGPKVKDNVQKNHNNVPKPNNNGQKENTNVQKELNNKESRSSNNNKASNQKSSLSSEISKELSSPICGKRKAVFEDDEAPLKIKRENQSLEEMFDIEDHLIEEGKFIELTKKLHEFACSYENESVLKLLSKIRQLRITAALLIKATDGFNTIRKLRKSDNKTIAAEMDIFYSKLVNELFWFLPSKKFWPSYLSLKEKILCYFDDYPDQYTRMIEIPEEFLMMNLNSSKPPSIRSEATEQNEENSIIDENTVENSIDEGDMIEPEERDDLYDVIPLITPDEKCGRLVVKYEEHDSSDINVEKSQKLVTAIESGKLDYRELPKGQVVLYNNEEENRKAVKFLKVGRQSKEEQTFTDITFKIKSHLTGKPANIDFKAVFNCFEELKRITYSATLLLKHSNCVFVIKNLREFDFKSSRRTGSLENKKLKIRTEAKRLYTFYKHFFNFLPGVKNFWKEYVDCKSKFDEILSNMPKDERCCVTELPIGLGNFYPKLLKTKSIS